MAWTAVTESDVLAEFTSREQAAVGAAQEGGDNLSDILSKVLAMARGYCKAVGATLETGSTTVPDQMVPDVISIARWKLLISAPSLRPLQTEERKAAHDAAMKRLEMIGTGDLPIEPASTVPTTNVGGSWGGQQRFNMRTHDETDDN